MKDTTVQQVASLHEKAVQAVASGEVAQEYKAPRRVRQSHAIASPITHTVVHPEVMATAKGLLENSSYTTIEILDAETVRVR